MGRAVLISLLVLTACGDDADDRCRVGARICRNNTVWLCGTDGVFSPERACADLNVCVDGVCTPPLQPDAVVFDTVGDVEVVDTVEPLPDTTPDSTLEVVDTWVADTITDTAVTSDDTRPPDTSADTQTPDTTPDTVPEDTTLTADTADTADTNPDTTVDTTPEPPDTVGPTPEAPPGILGYTKVGNVALTDDLIRVAWDPSGDFAFVLGTKGDVALFRPGQNLVKVGKVGSSPIDMVVVPTEVGVDLVILDTALGLLRTRLTESADALEPHVATTFPQGVARAIEAAPEGSPHFGSYAIATQQGSGPNTNYISYLYLWHPDTGLSPVKGFNASAGVTDIMWGNPTIYAGEPWLLTTHGQGGADSKSWIISSNTVVANNWSPGFGNAGGAAWRPDPSSASGLGLYGIVASTTTNAIKVYDGAWTNAGIPTANNGGIPVRVVWKWDGSRALIIGRATGAPSAATVIEHRPTGAAWSASFVNQSIANFTAAPWFGASTQQLFDLAWRPNTACDEGLIVGADSGTSSPTFGFAIHFVDLDDPACR